MYDDRNEARERRARSHLLRTTILDLLAGEEGELTAWQIQEALPDGPTLADVNYHLKVLGHNRLVLASRDGYRLP